MLHHLRSLGTTLLHLPVLAPVHSELILMVSALVVAEGRVGRGLVVAADLAVRVLDYPVPAFFNVLRDHRLVQYCAVVYVGAVSVGHSPYQVLECESAFVAEAVLAG